MVPINEKRHAAKRNIAERKKWKFRFDKRHTKPKTYIEGDLVVLENEVPATGDSRKLEQ